MVSPRETIILSSRKRAKDLLPGPKGFLQETKGFLPGAKGSVQETKGFSQVQKADGFNRHID